MNNNKFALDLNDYIGIMNLLFFHGRSVTEMTEGMLFFKRSYSIYKVEMFE